MEDYLLQLKNEIKFYGEKYKGKNAKTIYIGWGTPGMIGIDNILWLIEEIKKYFSLEFLEEFSIELNPYPQAEVLELVQTLTSKLKDLPRVRFSFGIQSFDDTVLTESGRPYTFSQIVEFLRNLREIKQENNVFNFDFIAFGKFNTTRSGNRQLRDQSRLKFFENFVHSGFADSFSLYTLELFEGSKWFNSRGRHCEWNEAIWPSDDDIYEEFSTIKEILLDAWYARYELSNFALPGKNSIHNMVYRTMQNYLWLGLASSSYINNVRFTNTANLNEYVRGSWLDTTKTIEMANEDYLIEKFFLNLRTNSGITDIDEFIPVMVPDYEKKLQSYKQQWFLEIDEKKLKLTDQWMDVFNSIITELLAKI